MSILVFGDAAVFFTLPLQDLLQEQMRKEFRSGGVLHQLHNSAARTCHQRIYAVCRSDVLGCVWLMLECCTAQVRHSHVKSLIRPLSVPAATRQFQCPGRPFSCLIMPLRWHRSGVWSPVRRYCGTLLTREALRGLERPCEHLCRRCCGTPLARGAIALAARRIVSLDGSVDAL